MIIAEIYTRNKTFSITHKCTIIAEKVRKYYCLETL